ncbi:MAG TPA: efflux RND transporter periplasmic adaptor subunit [Gemmatimonadaceae bacterium]|nr:efflux RND transporter periplasmic adaptor subunit [Gemmatimonadaceae bacterium]
MRLFYMKSVPAAALAALFTISLAACGTDTASSATPASRGPGGGPGGPGGNQISPVEIATVERATLARTSLVTGQLSPLRVVGVNSQVAGALLKVNVEEGSRVTEGMILAELDGREIEAQLRAARANHTLAKATAERSQQLRDAQVITAAEYERDQAALAAAEASLTQLETRVGFTKIRSPIDGVVTQRFSQAGDIVGGSARLFTVADLNTLVTQLPVSELEVPLLREGASVEVRVDALGRDIAGRIRRIFPAVDSVSRLVPVEVAISGAQQYGLRPGYSVRVTLKLDERDNALVIPTRAIVGAAGSQNVYVIRDGRAERRRVRVGADLDGRTEVFEGLAAGDTIITTGNALLRDGAQVRIVEPLAPEAPRPAVTVPATGTTPAPSSSTTPTGNRP